MVKWLLSLFKPTPLTLREQEICDAVADLKSRGILVVVSDRGGVKLEFENEEARKAHHKYIMDKFKNYSIK